MRRAVVISMCFAAACGSAAPPPPPPAVIPRATATPMTPAVPAPEPVAAPPVTTAAPAPSATTAAPAGTTEADAGAAFEVAVLLRDGGRGRPSTLSVGGKTVKSPHELTRQLVRIVAAHHGRVSVFFVHDSFGLATEDIVAAREAVEAAGIHDITFGVIPLEPMP